MWFVKNRTQEAVVMTSESPNQAGRPIPKEIPEGPLVFFYKPPTQTQVEKEGRMAKHLDHYRGPA
jgi:hypothetical protein